MLVPFSSETRTCWRTLGKLTSKLEALVPLAEHVTDTLSIANPCTAIVPNET